MPPKKCVPGAAVQWQNGGKSVVVAVGDVVGRVAEEEVRSPFSGIVMDLMALDGERVTARQPIAWLRTK